MIFDLLWLDGHSTCELPVHATGAGCSRGSRSSGPTWQTPPTTFGDGDAVLAAASDARARRCRRQAPRQPLPAGPALRRVAQGEAGKGQELVVGGWLPGAGRLEGRLGSLLVGYYDDGVLQLRGRVGLGSRRAHSAACSRRSSRRSRATTSPFENTPKLPAPHWVEPELVVEVGFHEWTSAGILRAPRYRGCATTRTPSEVVREIR